MFFLHVTSDNRERNTIVYFFINALLDLLFRLLKEINTSFVDFSSFLFILDYFLLILSIDNAHAQSHLRHFQESILELQFHRKKNLYDKYDKVIAIVFGGEQKLRFS